ncbi:hypothetical protein [Paraburkholderia youngii]|uniref:Uncharacterized protein n=1 Tax=Paraburkholderia youngii TaxID=2782701 RepID=A0ABX2NQ44_9BURK|nr:hypothetical protein [Paraburkholderia youngii]NVI06340.1 hypothetical protein [Paraburkholderia youngii]
MKNKFVLIPIAVVGAAVVGFVAFNVVHGALFYENRLATPLKEACMLYGDLAYNAVEVRNGGTSETEYLARIKEYHYVTGKLWNSMLNYGNRERNYATIAGQVAYEDSPLADKNQLRATLFNDCMEAGGVR